MIRTLKLSLFILPILLLVSTNNFGQNAETKTTLKNKIIIVAKNIMNSAKNCALITHDENGGTSIRMMDPFPPEGDFVVWLATNPKSRKVAQIKKNPKVTLYYTENDNLGYVMMQGTASLVTSPEEKEKRWKNGWERFYPNKGEDYLLIKVIPSSMEMVSYSNNLLGDSETWKPYHMVFEVP